MNELTASLSFTWPDGHAVFDRLDVDLPQGRSGLVGANGAGKSTLLRLLAGEITPTQGSVHRGGRLGYLPQDPTLAADVRVEIHLGIAAKRRALKAITAGDVAQRHFDTIGDDWDVEGRAEALLDRLGLPTGVLDRHLGELSGGELTQLGLARVLLDRPDILLLDEPTNNLDRAARLRLYDVVEDLRGSVLVVSHDRELLERVERIAELHAGQIHWYGGNLASYEDQLRAEQAAAEQSVRTAAAELRKQKQDLRRSEQILAGRRRAADRAKDNVPRIVAGAKKRKAEVSAGKLSGVAEGRVTSARERLDQAQTRVREYEPIRVDLVDTVVPARRIVLRTHELRLRNGERIDLAVDGPERIAVTGPNGSGKTTLLHTIAGRIAPAGGAVEVRVPLRLLPQRLDLLDSELSIAANLRAQAPTASPNEVRARLARFGFRGAQADRTVSMLSGGERFRATLAALLLAEPAPQLLLLDEPTNNLDFASLGQLVAALRGYGGALLVVSHDERFLNDIALTRRLELPSPLPSR